MQHVKKKDLHQVEYLGRWVDRESFRAFVFNRDGQKLARNWTEFQEMIASGLWCARKEDIEMLNAENPPPPLKEYKAPIDLSRDNLGVDDKEKKKVKSINEFKSNRSTKRL